MSENRKKEQSGGSGKLLAGLALAAVATWVFLSGEEGKARKRKVRGWMLRAKGEVLEKIEKTEDLSQEKYDEIVDTVLSKYYKAKNIAEREVDLLGADLKKHWRRISREYKQTIKDTKKDTKKKAAPKAKRAVKRKVEELKEALQDEELE